MLLANKNPITANAVALGSPYTGQFNGVGISAEGGANRMDNIPAARDRDVLS